MNTSKKTLLVAKLTGELLILQGMRQTLNSKQSSSKFQTDCTLKKQEKLPDKDWNT
jgi:hypothetical protein